MSIRSLHLFSRPRAVIGGVLASGMLLVSVGVAAPATGASTYATASQSTFCKTLLSFHATAPTSSNYKSYQAWAKTYLPYYQKLAAQAPNAKVKRVLSELVTILKYESSANLKQLGLYVTANRVKWTNDWKAFATSIIACATSMY
jgi:hypothetical protein